MGSSNEFSEMKVGDRIVIPADGSPCFVEQAKPRVYSFVDLALLEEANAGKKFVPNYVVCGSLGVGKSYVANLLLGRDAFPSKYEPYPLTTQVQLCDWNGKCVIDTPCAGFSVLRELKFMKSDKPVYVFVVSRISDIKFVQNAVEKLRIQKYSIVFNRCQPSVRQEMLRTLHPTGFGLCELDDKYIQWEHCVAQNLPMAGWEKLVIMFVWWIVALVGWALFVQ
jgi:hypothetical protein